MSEVYYQLSVLNVRKLGHLRKHSTAGHPKGNEPYRDPRGSISSPRYSLQAEREL